jgi:polyisoprenoid-binding protein YceI
MLAVRKGYPVPSSFLSALRLAGVLAGFSLVLGACAGPAPAAPSSSAPTGSAVGARTDLSSAVSPGSSAVGGAPTSASPEGAAIRIALVPENSQARFRAREQLAGATLPNEAVGSTPDVTGAIVLDGAGNVNPDQSRIVVGLLALRSDQRSRDNYIHGNTLQTQQFPVAEFVPIEARGAPTAVPVAGEATFQLMGNLTVHGVTRPAVWDVAATFAGSEMAGRATTRVKITDFGMPLPQVARVLSLEDELSLELEFRALTSSEPAAAGVAAPPTAG